MPVPEVFNGLTTLSDRCYSGESYSFLLFLMRNDGTPLQVTPLPLLTVVRLADEQPVVSQAEMQRLEDMPGAYEYVWNTTGIDDGNYLALTSYTANEVTVTQRLLGKVQVGDTRLTGKVALEATAAKDLLIAKAATTVQAFAYVSPNSSLILQDIWEKVDSIPACPASQTALASLLSLLTDIKDQTLGSWVANKRMNTLTFLRENGQVLKVLKLTNDDSLASRL
jgi:hypothetical protein